MITVLAILIIASLTALGVGFSRAYGHWAGPVAAIGAGVALVAHVVLEGLDGGGSGGAVVEWPSLMAGLGTPVYRSDALAVGLGAWCLLLGGLCLLAGGRYDSGAGWRRGVRAAAGLLVVATLYSLVYTWDLRVFAAQMLLLLPLLWAANGVGQSDGQQANGEPVEERPGYSVGLGLGGLCLLAAVLMIGQITGGRYGLAEVSLSALAPLPLALMAVGMALWVGLLPVTGWSAMGHKSDAKVLAQGLVLGVPVAALLLRLQALVTAQDPAGSAQWSGFMSALGWAGGLTAIAAGAGTILAAGTPGWMALLTAHSLGLMTWALALDTPQGRVAALAILLAFGAARVTLEFAQGSGSPYAALAAGFSLAAAPLTAGFVGAWLLAATLSQQARPSIAIALLGAVLLAACGTALHLGGGRIPADRGQNSGVGRVLGWVALAGGIVLVAGGIAPGLWLPEVASMAGIAGGGAAVALPWTGIAIGDGLLAPFPLLGLAALVIAGIGRLVGAWMRSGATQPGILLPTAISRIEATGGSGQPKPAQNPVLNAQSAPVPVWWVSLTWLEEGLWGFGEMLGRLGARAGVGLGRLEGRYQVPLVLVLILVALLAVIR